jgi:CrcB protein
MGTTWIAVALGGAIGSLARHGVNMAFLRTAPAAAVPYATFVVNGMGSAVIGLLAGLIAANRLELGASGRAFVFVGVLGGFTTFSSFALDTLTLARGGAGLAAAWNAAGQVVVALAACYAGFVAAHWRG